MNRRDFFQAAGLGTYSLVVLAGDSADQTQRRPRDFDAVAPKDAPFAPAEKHMRVVELETDILVAGGGLAGVCTALAAARHGARVVLVQDRSRLGGNSSSEVKMHVVGANNHNGRPGWREGGLIEELRLADAVNNPQRSWELWDLLLYDKVVSEPNVTLLLETTLYSASVADGRIGEVAARCDKSEHLYRIRARIFCDCTGDSRLGLEAGAEMRSGREARAEFGESLAPEQPDDRTLGSSILFTSRLYHNPMPFTAPAWARKITKEQLIHRPITTWEYGYWWIEWGGDKDIVADNERIRFELLSIVMGVWDYIKNSGAFPDSRHWAMDWVGMMPGKRGSRRLIGDYILKQEDLIQAAFPDAVAIGGWPMDGHPPEGFDRPDLPPNTVLRPPEVYDIPLRSLYSRNIANLFMAGRNISASYVAFTSARVMATCAVEGQAIGTAAAQCIEMQLLPRELARDPGQVERLRQTLLRDDQTIKGLQNQDSLDLARTATVTASAPSGAALVIDGFTRDVPDRRGDPMQVHHWAAPSPAWIELRWPRPQRIRAVQITFDTGFRRQLTLSAQESQNVNLLRAPQPETVRDYRVICGGRTMAEVRGNFQRQRRHACDAIEADSVRIEITATNGDPNARIFEIRCYS
ncbi:MAG TPA: FAD-dependent oxidoreductase [Candidatus Acidoferrales bacterium]|nr:FAD-dependent oxidoreductase [Candidatus Acidoferrales bacterium]